MFQGDQGYRIQQFQKVTLFRSVIVERVFGSTVLSLGFGFDFAIGRQIDNVESWWENCVNRA